MAIDLGDLMAGIGSALIGKSGAKSAQKAANKALQKALDQQLYFYQQGRADAAPWMQTGMDALNLLRPMVGLAPQDWGALDYGVTQPGSTLGGSDLGGILSGIPAFGGNNQMPYGAPFSGGGAGLSGTGDSFSAALSGALADLGENASLSDALSYLRTTPIGSFIPGNNQPTGSDNTTSIVAGLPQGPALDMGGPGQEQTVLNDAEQQASNQANTGSGGGAEDEGAPAGRLQLSPAATQALWMNSMTKAVDEEAKLRGFNRPTGVIPKIGGGTTIPGQTYMVGEAGPEMVMDGNRALLMGTQGPETYTASTAGAVIPNAAGASVAPPTDGTGNIINDSTIDPVTGQPYAPNPATQSQTGVPSLPGMDPSYGFRFDEGLRALDQSAAARGLSASGGTLRALTRYGQDYASTEYMNIYNRISNLAGMGQVAAQGVGGMGVNTAGMMGNTYGQIGQANAYGALGQSNALNQGLSSIYGASQYNSFLDRLFGGGGP